MQLNMADAARTVLAQLVVPLTIVTASALIRRSDEEWHGPGPKPLVRPGATELQKHARLNNMLTSRVPDVLTHMNLRLAQER
jgi:hypothetical protein